jgi:Acetyltransferase (GNAT) family.
MLNYVLYSRDLSNIPISDFFFDGWPNPPSNESHRRILEESYKAIVCIDDSIPEIVGFINSVSDGILSAYIPLLEVIPSYQGRGIGKELVSRLKAELDNLYMIDLLCDANLVPFYEKLDMIPSQGMILRNYEFQNAKNNIECKPTPINKELIKEELRLLEETFCKDVAKLGAVGWSKYFSTNGCMLTKNGIPILGNKEIEHSMKAFFEIENLLFNWEPTHIEVSDDATLAVTYGKYKRSYTKDDSAIEESGMYMTVWNKQTDGTWKISADIGN